MQNVLPRSRSAYLDSECRNRAISFDSGTSTSAQSSPSTAKLWRPVRPSVQPNFRVAPGVTPNIGLLCRTPLGKSAADWSDLGIRMDFDEAPIAADACGLVALTGIHVVASGLLSIER